MNTRTFLRICAAAIPGTILFPRALFAQTPKVMLGIDVLESRKFAPIAWKKVGLLTHPAGVNRFGTSTIDVLRRARNVKLVALFGPEHGIYGTTAARACLYIRSMGNTENPRRRCSKI